MKYETLKPKAGGGVMNAKPPGHEHAVANGCTCPVIDNGHGAGCGYVDSKGNAVFIISCDCPLHADAP